MAKADGGGGGTAGKLWRKHGRGYYALLAVGTFVYLEIVSLSSSVREAGSVTDFFVSELLTFAIESFVNTLRASFWPFSWYSWMGTEALYWACGGYAVFAVVIAAALSRREKHMRKELGL